MSRSTRPLPANAEPEVWTREETIARLREGLLRLGDGEHSMCQIAAEKNIFCRGFRRWGDAEFHRCWTRVMGRTTHLSRPQMEMLADIWQLAEQLRERVPLACDVPLNVKGACRGWNEFSNEDLERFCDEILGRNVVIDEIGSSSCANGTQLGSESINVDAASALSITICPSLRSDRWANKCVEEGES